MKVFFDTNVLIDIAVRSDEYPHSMKVVNEVIERSGVSPWVSAISLNNIEYIVSKLGQRQKAYQLLQFISDRFSIIPVRKSVFVKALNIGGLDFEDNIQMASAEQLGMDYIVTRKTDHFKSSEVPAATPSEFLQKWNDGEFDGVSHVPFLDLKAQHYQIYNEVDDRITDIIANTGFILGKYVEEFEEGFAGMQGAKYCIGVSSGTDALHVAALMALGIGPGDRVIVPVNTFIATAEAVSLCGAVPVFADCDNYYNINTAKLSDYLSALSFQHRAMPMAIIPVHLYGQPVNMDEIMALANEYDLMVVEDCCQAHLATWRDKMVGNFGAFGAFSFYPGKNLGAYGEAGALITNDEGLYLKAKMLRQHGEIERYHHQVIGHNYRMEAIQGAVLSTKLKYIEEWTRKRQENARLYTELLADIDGIQTPAELEGASCVYHIYVIQVDDRDGLREYLQENGVASGLHYPVSLHLQEAYKDLGYKRGDFPMAERAAGRILSLPMYPELTEEQIRYVCNEIKDFMGSPQRRRGRREK